MWLIKLNHPKIKYRLKSRISFRSHLNCAFKQVSCCSTQGGYKNRERALFEVKGKKADVN
jgi:hypothetical protein